MKIAIIGDGGHSKVIKELIQAKPDHQIMGYFDDRYPDIELKKNIYFGPVSYANQMALYFRGIKFVIAIGDNQIRKQIVHRLDLTFDDYITLIHSSAFISPSAKIGNGTVIMAHSVVHAGTQIGDHVIMNTGSVIEHDNRIGDFAHVSPHATLTGAVKLGEGAHIGAGATIIPDVNIGKWSKIGAGATVLHDISAGCTAVGVPARMIREKETGGEGDREHNQGKENISLPAAHERERTEIYKESI